MERLSSGNPVAANSPQRKESEREILVPHIEISRVVLKSLQTVQNDLLNGVMEESTRVPSCLVCDKCPTFPRCDSGILRQGRKSNRAKGVER